MERRSFFKTSLGAVAGSFGGAAIPWVHGGVPARPGNELRIPPLWTNGDDLVVAPARLPIWPGFSTSVYAINGAVPGPTIRLARGELFESRVVNRLEGEPVVLHWHGVLAPEKMDGHPLQQIESGESYDVRFRIDQRGATCWYHSHTDMLTAEQVYKGLAGLFIIDDPAQDGLGLPADDHDVPLVIADWRSNAERELRYEVSNADRMRGYLGDAALVNGTPNAWFSVDQGRYRFRLLNGSNARIFKITFSDNRPFYLIGADGGLHEEPIKVRSGVLAPGQRLEILADFADVPLGESVVLRSLGVPRDTGPPFLSQDLVLDLVTFYVDRAERLAALPTKLVPFEAWRSDDAVRTRRFTLSSSQGRHYINEMAFEMSRVDFDVPKGELEIWEYQNLGQVYHPMHMHATHFQVLERVGRSLNPEDVGWRDTVLVNPGETVRVLLRFDAHPGLFLHHCHNLEHEDAGMMQNFAVLPDPEADFQIACDEATCTVSWSAEVTGDLETSTDLLVGSWEAVSEEPSLGEGRYSLTLARTGARRFFRLVNVRRLRE